MKWEELLEQLNWDMWLDDDLRWRMPSPHFSTDLAKRSGISARRRRRIQDPERLGRQWFKKALDAGLTEAQAVYVGMRLVRIIKINLWNTGFVYQFI